MNDELLTLDELKWMDGEPVWIEMPNKYQKWVLIRCSDPKAYFPNVIMRDKFGYTALVEDALATGVKFYRRKPGQT